MAAANSPPAEIETAAFLLTFAPSGGKMSGQQLALSDVAGNLTSQELWAMGRKHFRRAGRWLAALALALAAMLANRACQADTPSVQSAVEGILACGAKQSPKILAQARELHDDARRLAPSDVRVDYSYALVLARHNRYAESQELFDQIATAKRGQTRRLARQLRAWLLVAEAHDREALSELKSLAELLAVDRQDHGDRQQHGDRQGGVDRQEQAEYVEAGRLSGVLLGYLEAADREKLTPGEISAAKDQFRQSLGPKAREAFEEGLTHVARRHTQLQQSLDETKAHENQDADIKREKEETELGQAKQHVDESRQELESAKQAQQEKYRQEAARLEAAAGQWQTAYQASVAALGQVQSQIAALQAQRPGCFRIVEEKNGQRREEVVDVARLAAIDGGINQLSAQLGPLQARVARLEADGQALMLQRQSLEGAPFSKRPSAPGRNTA